MTIAIIGGGLTGLTAAYELLKEGHQVTVFEKGKTLGGLAGGFTMPNWQWNLEYFYHHFFTNDSVIINLVKELGLEKEMLILRPVTATLVRNIEDGRQKTEDRKDNLKDVDDARENDISKECSEQTKFYADSLVSDELGSKGVTGVGGPPRRGPLVGILGGKRPAGPREYNQTRPYIYQLDSPMNLLTFPLLSPLDKLRTAVLLVFCKINPFWQPLEKITAVTFFKTLGGARAWETLWEPLMVGKFGDYAKDLPTSWLWARIHKRTMRLGYFRGGFQTFVDALVKNIEKRGGIIYSGTEITSIKIELGIRNKELGKNENQYPYSSFIIHNSQFDKVLLTTPSSVAVKLLDSYIPACRQAGVQDSLFVDEKKLHAYMKHLQSINHLYAQTLILETKEPILDTVYWLNINDRSFPFIAVVAHTNMVDKKQYGGNHVTYIGNYLPDNHPYLKMTKQQLLKLFLPYLQKINPSFRLLPSDLCHLFSAPAAQPVHTINYSQQAPSIQTPIPGMYLANLDSIYPWDRGTNYAVDLGQRAAHIIQGNS